MPYLPNQGGVKFLWSDDFRAWMLKQLLAREGAPYQFGAKWKWGDLNPQGPIDCSGLLSWWFSLGNIKMPEGSWNQMEVLEEWNGGAVRPFCVGFSDSLDDEDERVDHVNIVISATEVIEARGGRFMKVVRRPLKNWEAYKGFKGWYFLRGTVAKREVA